MMKQRNRSFDMFKGIACIAVVFIHCMFPEPIGTGIRGISRFAVPLFFVVSGYYLSSAEEIDPVSMVRKLRHILRLIVFSELFYIVFSIFYYDLFDHQNLIALKEKYFPTAWFTKYVVLNQPPVYAHLWYLYASLTIYLGVTIIFKNRKQIRNLSYILFPFSLLTMIFLQEFSGLGLIRNSFRIPGTEAVLYWSSFFLFRSVPFFLLGFLGREYEETIKRSRVRKELLVFLIVLFSLFALVESYIFSNTQFYVGNILAVIAITVFCIKYPESTVEPLETLGGGLSTNIYVYHIAVMKLFDLVLQKMHLVPLPYAFKMARPIIVLLLCIGISYMIEQCKEFFRV